MYENIPYIDPMGYPAWKLIARPWKWMGLEAVISYWNGPFSGDIRSFSGGYILIWKSVIVFFSPKISFETLTTDGDFGSIARWKTTKRHHMCQGRSTPYIGDGHPTFNDGNPYFMAI